MGSRVVVAAAKGYIALAAVATADFVQLVADLMQLAADLAAVQEVDFAVAATAVFAVGGMLLLIADRALSYLE